MSDEQHEQSDTVFAEAARFHVSDACRAEHGDEGAVDEALRRLKSEAMLCLKGWKAGEGTRFHLGLMIERKR